MKITSIKKIVLALLLLGATLLLQPSAQAQDSLGEIVGTAWSIGNAIVGTTTLTPAYAISSWYSHQEIKTSAPFGNLNITYKVTRDDLGNYSYSTKKVIDPADPYPNPTESTAQFPVNGMNKLNLTCTSTNRTTVTVDTENEVVWLASVTRTGLWPDDGPWTVYLKTGGSETACGGISGGQIKYWWAPASVSQGGSPVTVSLGTPNAVMNYPFYLASDFYK